MMPNKFPWDPDEAAVIAASQMVAAIRKKPTMTYGELATVLIDNLAHGGCEIIVIDDINSETEN